MSNETNKMILRRFFEELFSQGNLAVADEIVGDGYLNHNAVPGEQPGRTGLVDFVRYLRGSIPDIHFTVEQQLAEGDKVVTHWTVTGTHQGEFMGIPATGHRVTVGGINIHRVSNGQIQEAWLNWDALGLMQQLGAIPTPE